MRKIKLIESRPGRKRLSVDMPLYLYIQMVKEAEAEGVSISWFVRKSVYKYIKDQD